MSESYHKKRRTEFSRHGSGSNHSSHGSIKKFETSDRDHFRFSSRRTEQWPLFLQKHETESMEEDIGCPVKIAATKTKTPRPAFRAFVPTLSGESETDAEKEERLYQQKSFDTAEWKATEDKHVKAEQQLEKDSEKRLAIILHLTDNKINDSIHDCIKTSCDGIPSVEKASAVFSFVSTAHGPHSNLDAQNLREALGTSIQPMYDGLISKQVHPLLHDAVKHAAARRRRKAQAWTCPAAQAYRPSRYSWILE
jgi:hypothetical protein